MNQVLDRKPAIGVNEGLDDPAQFERLDEELKKELVAWIRVMLVEAATLWPHWTSYGLKHVFQHELDFGADSSRRYVCNGAFKGAMRYCGFDPVDPEARNWQFRVRPVDRAVWHYIFFGEHRSRTDPEATLARLEGLREDQAQLVRNLRPMVQEVASSE